MVDKVTKIKINKDEKLAPIGDLYGLFFEDINHAADGGLYAEMIQNRSFEFCELDNSNYHSLYAWETENGEELSKKIAGIRVLSDDPLHPKNQHYLKINQLEETSIRNRGYNQGLYLKENEAYRISFFAKPDLNNQKVIIQFQDASGKVYSEKTIEINQEGWHRYYAEMIPIRTVIDGRFALVFPPITDLALDMVSVFPKNTFKGRENGCRKDLAEKLAEMHPKFMRFPGGCLVHDGSLNSDDHDSMYRWKNTIGPVESRPTKRNNWGYNQSLGLGFYEYFQLCEDIGAKPIPVIPAGCDPHHQRAVPIEELDSWIQDALDLIEFANGKVTSTWGGIRAEMGHPAPFCLEYLGIGNEEVGQEFFDRYAYFHEAMRKVYPEIKLINSAGPFSAGSEYDRGWDSARKNQSDLIDEHYYATPEWFLAHHHRYDTFDSDDPKVFLGEYAANANRWWNALAEASYMIGLERNADKVVLACYAPLFANVDYVSWTPNLIWFNQEKVVSSVNYEIQKLFSTMQGTHNVLFEVQDMPTATIVDNQPITGEFGLSGNWADIEIEELTVTNLETGEITVYEAQEVKDNEQVILGQVESQHYTATFNFTKVGGQWDKGFYFLFGRENEQNQYMWSLGGWQNQDCLISRIKDGADSVLTQSIWKVELNKTYSCKLEVNQRKVTTTIDSQIFNNTEDLPLIIQPAYINAVYNQEKESYYLKVVNVQNRSFRFELENDYRSMNVIQLSASPESENDFDKFQQVDIQETTITDEQKEITVAPYSVMFLELPNN